MELKVSKVEINPSYEWNEEIRDAGVSHRELELFSLVLKGYSNKEIAEILNIKHQSVKNHLHNLYKKLRVKNSGQALMVAIGNKLIQVEEEVKGEKVKFNADKYIELLNYLLRDENPDITKKVRRKGKIWLKSRGIDIEI